MPFARPSLTTIVSRVRQDLKTASPDSEPFFRLSFEYALTRAIAFLTHGQHGHVEWGVRQTFADTAEDEYFWRRLALHGITRKAATKWTGSYVFTATAAATVPAGTLLAATSGGQYMTDTELVFASAGSASVGVEAATGYEGSAYNLDVGAGLSLTTPIGNVQSAGTVAAVSSDGSDLEARDAAFERYLQVIRNPPSSGTAADYERWARTVSGVTRAGAFSPGNGQVAVYFVRDGDWDGTEGNASDIIPSSGEVAAVQAVLDANRPVPAQVTAYAPIQLILDLSISIEPNTTAVQDAVRTELIDFLANLPVSTAHDVHQTSVDEVISTAPGEVNHTITLAPSFPVSVGADQVLTLGTITWSSF